MTAVEKTGKRPERLKFGGRVLFLTEDVSLVRRQLEGGEDLEFDPARPLMNNISTDEITPGWVCFYYDETLGEYVYVGMREGAVKKDEVKQGGFRRGGVGVVEGVRVFAGDGAVRGEGRRAATRHREDDREDLRAELPEHRAADFDGFRP